MFSGRFYPLLFIALLLSCSVSLAAPTALIGMTASADATVAPSPDAQSQAAVRQRLSAVNAELTALNTTVSSDGDGIAAGAREHLEAIARLLRQQLDVIDQAQPGQGAVLPESLPPTLFSLYRLHEAYVVAIRRQEALKETVSAARSAMDDAKKRWEQAEKLRRQAQEAPGGSELNDALALRVLESRRIAEELQLRSLELQFAQQAATGNRAEALSQRIESLEKQLRGSESTLASALLALADREGDARRLQDRLQRELATADLELQAKEKRYASTSEADADLLEDIRLLAARRDVLQRRLLLVDTQLERLTELRGTWQRWDRVLRSAKAGDEFSLWLREAKDQQIRLEQEKIKRQGRVLELRQRLDETRSRLAAHDGLPRHAGLLKQAAVAYEELLKAQNAEMELLGQEWRLREYLSEDIRERRSLLDVGAQWRKFIAALVEFWRYEITDVDDRPITVGSVAIAMLLMIIGLMVSRRLSALLGRAVGRRLKVDAGAVAAIETLSFYLLLVSFSLLALRAVNFPLTAFTVLGGALAIGIGFGSQNVMNNFISGLILMLERPVRAGDVIEVEGNHGVIEKIGARSTQIRSTDGRHLIVPNSFFLESNVVNWTLSDDLFRGKVTVGVAYGSDTRRVDQLISQVIDAEPGILRDREAITVFEDFGDSALIFDVYFWVHARSPMELRRVQSRIRFALDDAFREADIVIAFPQRDLHLTASEPLPVRVMDSENPNSA